MDEFYADWRRRFIVAAACLLVLSGWIGCEYHDSLTHDDPGCSTAGAERWCDTSTSSSWCSSDSPCETDTVVEQRWSAAHQQGLLHALLLLGFAIAAPFLRLGRPLFTVVGWSLIIGCLGAPVGATIQAATTLNQGPPVACLVPTTSLLPAWECLGITIGTFAGPITGIGLGLAALRSLWEVIRGGIAPPTWRNWARIVSAHPRSIAEPRSLDELVAAVQSALDQRTRVRAFGGKYSWSDVASCDGLMIDMRELNAIGALEPRDGADIITDAGAQLITVQAGATVRQVTEYLSTQGLMLASTPVNAKIQVGGALALGCHGTGIHQAQFSDLVKQLRIVQYAPATRTAVVNVYTRPPDGTAAWNAAWDDWNALAVNLGSLGIVYEVTLECVKLESVHLQDQVLPMQATIASDAALQAIVTAPKTFSEIFWFPYNEECFVRAWGPPVPGDPPWQPALPFLFWLWQWTLARILGPIGFGLLALFPFLTPLASKLFHALVAMLNYTVPAPEAMQYERHFHRVLVTGHAIPIHPLTPDFTLFRRAWFDVVDRLNAARHRAQYPQNLVVHVRFGRGSRAYLATNNGSGHFAFIEIITHVHTPHFEEHFTGVERSWLHLGGRAHWGKMTFHPEDVVENFPQAPQFLAVRERMDPDGVFLTDYVRELLHV